jgi:ethanolamine permease
VRGPRVATPHRALLAGGAVGLAAIFSDQWVQFGGQSLTANIVTLSVFGAIVMYIVSMAALFKLRRSEPALARPYRAPFYPLLPALALLLALVCLGAMVWCNLLLAAVFFGVFALAFGYYALTAADRAAAAPDAWLGPSGG